METAELKRAIEEARDRRAQVTEQAAEDLVAACVRARKGGMTMTEIARTAGFTRQGLRKLFERHGVGVVYPDRVNRS